jgi:hypothetical protein
MDPIVIAITLAGMGYADGTDRRCRVVISRNHAFDADKGDAETSAPWFATSSEPIVVLPYCRASL